MHLAARLHSACCEPGEHCCVAGCLLHVLVGLGLWGGALTMDGQLADVNLL